jgi:MFS family permease
MTSRETTSWPPGLRALQHRNYRLFFVGQLISVVGSWMQSVAQAWLVYRLTGSELLLGLVGFTDKVPVFLLGLAGGVVADRLDRHRIVITTQTLAMVQAATLGVLVVAGRAEVWHIFLMSAVLGVVNAFDLPARQSFISAMVDREDLPNALALNSSVFNAARVIGPALAGIVVAAIGEGPCFLLNAISYMAVIGCLLAMRLERRPRSPQEVSTARHLARGLRYAGGAPPVRALLTLLGLVSVCGMPYVVLMPVFAGEILGGGARSLGTLMGASGVGAFLSAVALARRRSVKGLGRVVAAGSIGFGLSLIALALSRSFVLSAVILVVVGFSMITQAAATNLLLQSLCPDDLRGRVMSLYTIMFVGMAPWGSLLAGALAHGVGTPATVGIGGLLCALAGAIFALQIPRLRRYVTYPIPDAPAR